MNPYIVVLVFFTLAGLAMAAWGWRNIARARKTRHWLRTEGTVEQSGASRAVRYTVAGTAYRLAAAADGDAAPAAAVPPAGAKVDVYYDPARPGDAALSRYEGRDDWLIVAIGLGAALFGLGALLFSG